MWDLSSLIRNQTCVPCTARQDLNHWITGESPHTDLCKSFNCGKKKKSVQWGKDSSDGTLEVTVGVKKGHSEDVNPEAWDALEALGCDPDKAPGRGRHRFKDPAQRDERASGTSHWKNAWLGEIDFPEA